MDVHVVVAVDALALLVEGLDRGVKCQHLGQRGEALLAIEDQPLRLRERAAELKFSMGRT